MLIEGNAFSEVEPVDGFCVNIGTTITNDNRARPRIEAAE